MTLLQIFRNLSKKIWYIIMFSITISFVIISFWNHALFTGWIIGIIFAFINNQFNQLFFKYLIRKNLIRKTTRYSFWMASMKVTFFWIISGGLLISIIMINKVSQGKTWWDKDMNFVLYPINLFSLLTGFTIMKFYPLVYNRRDNHEAVKR